MLRVYSFKVSRSEKMEALAVVVDRVRITPFGQLTDVIVRSIGVGVCQEAAICIFVEIRVVVTSPCCSVVSFVQVRLFGFTNLP